MNKWTWLFWLFQQVPDKFVLLPPDNFMATANEQSRLTSSRCWGGRATHATDRKGVKVIFGGAQGNGRPGNGRIITITTGGLITTRYWDPIWPQDRRVKITKAESSTIYRPRSFQGDSVGSASGQGNGTLDIQSTTCLPATQTSKSGRQVSNLIQLMT